MNTTFSRWFVPVVGFVIGIAMALVALVAHATPLQAFIAFAIVACYAVGLRILQSHSETASLLSGMPVDERWHDINRRALALAAQALAVILLIAFLVTRLRGGDALTFAWLAAAFAAAYMGGILWYKWRG